MALCSIWTFFVNDTKENHHVIFLNWNSMLVHYFAHGENAFQTSNTVNFSQLVEHEVLILAHIFHIDF